MSQPILYTLEEEGLIEAGMTVERFKEVNRKWELQHHPDRGGSHPHYVKIKGYLATFDKDWSLPKLRRYFKAVEIMGNAFTKHDLSPETSSIQLRRFAQAMWGDKSRLNAYFDSLQRKLVNEKWSSKDVKVLISAVKNARDVRKTSSRVIKKVSKLQKSPVRRIGWVKFTPATKRCRKCSSIAKSTGSRCRLPASCRLGCEVKCWRHSSVHRVRQSCRD